MPNETPSTEQTAQDANASEDAAPQFTQEQVNAFLAETKRKTREAFADYDELKAKASQLDELQNAAKSDVEKANDRAARLERDLEKARGELAQREHALLVAEVASAKGAPAQHLTGSSREELEASADALLAWRAEAQPARRVHAPVIRGAATGAGEHLAASIQSGRDRARAKRDRTH